jgi:hypothetical protein
MERNEPLPIASSLSASIPRLKFEGEQMESPEQRMEGFDLHVRRADNVIVVSVIVMVLMMALALSVLLMGIHALTSGEDIDLVPLSLAITLLFGLPALRDVQPGVPPLGAFGDYLSFIWAEVIVAVSAIITIWAWLLRRRTRQDQ